MQNGIGGHQRAYEGRTNDWITPKNYIDCLGPFDLDPCASFTQPWPCAKHSYIENGLSQPWDGFIWLNPPYGPHVGNWLARLYQHQNGIAMIFARTDTEFFHKWIFNRANAILFLAGRPYFHYPDGERAAANSGGPICLVAYGTLAVNRLINSKLKGHLIKLR